IPSFFKEGTSEIREFLFLLQHLSKELFALGEKNLNYKKISNPHFTYEENILVFGIKKEKIVV
ncbi:MAG: hypothetical protein ACFFDI_30860, partial [Promethearchaeota archaeon]